MNPGGGDRKIDVPEEQAREIYFRHVVSGEPLENIARELSRDPAELRKEIEWVEVWLAGEFAGDPKRLRVRHTARLEEIFRKALAGYERSCEDEVVHKRTAQGGSGGDSADGTRARGNVDPAKLRVETVTKRKAGNARFLWEARSALADIRRLWGANPSRIDEPNAPATVSTDMLESASDEDLAALSAAGVVLLRLAEQAEKHVNPGNTTAHPPEAPAELNVMEP